MLWNGHAINRLLKSGYVVELRQDGGVDFDASLMESDGICHFVDTHPDQPGIPGVQSLLGRGLRWVSGDLSQPDSWVSAHRLRTDLSGFQVVRDQAYITLLQSLQRLIDFAW